MHGFISNIRFFVATVLSLLLASCGGYELKPQEDITLAENEAFLLTRVTSNKKCTTYFEYGDWTSYIVVPYPYTDLEPRIILIKIPAEELTMIKAVNADGFFGPAYIKDYRRELSNEEQIRFAIKPGSINYIGDIFHDIGGNDTVLGTTFIRPWKTQFSDQMNETVEEAKKQYPGIFQHYVVVNQTNQKITKRLDKVGDELLRKSIEQKTCLSAEDIPACLKNLRSK